MRDYQPKKSNPYYLPPTLYRRALALVRDFPRMTSERMEIIYASPEPLPGGSRNHVGDPTAAKAIRIENLEEDIRVIEKALEQIPLEYRRGVLDNILYGERREVIEGAGSATWSRWRARFLYYVARNRGWAE